MNTKRQTVKIALSKKVLLLAVTLTSVTALAVNARTASSQSRIPEKPLTLPSDQTEFPVLNPDGSFRRTADGQMATVRIPKDRGSRPPVGKLPRQLTEAEIAAWEKAKLAGKLPPETTAKPYTPTVEELQKSYDSK
jgi:hypothetical protein